MWIYLLLTLPSVASFNLKECRSPLGMTSGEIADRQISASSSFDEESTGPQHSRARLHTGGGAWCPKSQISHTSSEWIEVRFDKHHVISMIETEGRFDNGRGQEFLTSYRLEYWRPELSDWVIYKNNNGQQTIAGNTDTRSAVFRQLEGAIVVRRIRIIPISNRTRTVCFRFELYGCVYEDELSSYGMRDGSKADGLSLRDISYDGKKVGGVLHGGLGKLHDGIVGHDSFEMFSEKWIGWRKDKTLGEFVTIEFTFSTIQNISAFLFHSTNLFNSHAAAPSFIRMEFSLDGISFSRRFVELSYEEDTVSEASRWIQIQIPHRIALVVKVSLWFGPNAHWLALSEVKFESASVADAAVMTDVDAEIVAHSYSIMIIVWIMFIIVLFCLLGSIFYCVMRKRNKIKASSPSPTFHTKGKEFKVVLSNTGTLKHVTRSIYQIQSDNERNEMLEKRPLTSDYAEPDLLLLSSFSSFSDNSFPFSTLRNSSEIQSQNSSSLVKYSDYGKVYCTTLPEIDRSKIIFYEKIGQGEFGEVFRCELENRPVAVKKLHGTSQLEENAFQREIRVLGALKHPNVVEVLGVSTIDRPMICVMEWMQNGDLKTYLNKTTDLSTARCVEIITQLAAGLAYLESCNFVHRDLAARNCLVDGEGQVKVSDFGLARSLYSEEYYKVDGRSCVLPIRWMAPETLLMGRFSTASDIWAYGVLVWEVFTGGSQRPFDHLPDQDVIRLITDPNASELIRQHLPRPEPCPELLFSSLLVECWHQNANQRPTFEKIHRNLQIWHSRNFL